MPDGYIPFRCPKCGKRSYVESGCVAECSCGWSEEDEVEEKDTLDLLPEECVE